MAERARAALTRVEPCASCHAPIRRRGKLWVHEDGSRECQPVRVATPFQLPWARCEYGHVVTADDAWICTCGGTVGRRYNPAPR